MNKILAVLVFLLFSVGGAGLTAKEELSYYFRGGASFLSNSTSMPAIPGNFICGEYTAGKATGYYLGLGAEYGIFRNLIFIDAGLAFEARPVDLQAFSECYQVFDPSVNDYVDLFQRHDFTGHLNYLMIDAGISASPFGAALPLKLRLGFDAGNPVLGTGFTNTQSIERPTLVNYPNGTRENRVGQGELSSAGTAIGVSGALSYGFAINEEFSAGPEITYRKGLNSALSDYKFETDIIRLGIRISYSEHEPKAPHLTPVEERNGDSLPRVMVQAEKPVHIKNFITGNTRVLETVVTQTYPLLNYIFFDSASSVLQEKFRSGEPTTLFDEKKLPKSTLGIYYRILDVIGSRMRANPSYRVSFTGVTDGVELPDKDQRLALAAERAKNAAKYLSSRWNIDMNRIGVRSKETPAVPTSVQYAEGYQENRRVEIYSDNDELLQPVSHTRFMEYEADRKKHPFEAMLNDPEQIKNVILNIKEDGKVIISKTIAPEKNIRYDLELDSEMLTALLEKDGSELTAELSVTTRDYATEKSETGLNITKQKNNFEIGRLNLIVFDFDRAEISAVNRTMIRNFVATSLRDNSETVITGSTDRLGEAAYNSRLSSERAAAVEAYIRDFLPGYIFKEVKGTGSSVLPYDNKLPEGRFYCRTVLIEVKTPLDR